MCNICLKYKCPNGCPNNYTPRRKERKKETNMTKVGFRVLVEIGMQRELPDAVESVKKQ